MNKEIWSALEGMKYEDVMYMLVQEAMEDDLDVELSRLSAKVITSDMLKSFTEKYPIVITPNICREIELLCKKFETRGTHPLALNSVMLGIDPIYFTPEDHRNFFDVFKINPVEFRKTFESIPAIDMTRKVTSDAFNVWVSWVLYRAYNSTLPKSVKRQFMWYALKMLHYRYFTSLVNHNFPYMANKGIMQATMNSLSNKFDIIKLGTWKNVIEARCDDILDEHTSIHWNTLTNYGNDNGILYFISDTQTRIRNKIKIIVCAYHASKNDDRTITDYGNVKDINGEKLLTNGGITYDAMISGVFNLILNKRNFVDFKQVSGISGMFSSLRPDMFRTVLNNFSELATEHARNGTSDRVITKKGDDKQIHTVYVGSKALITALIQKTYRHCIQNGANMSSKMDILVRTRNLYASSRIIDKDILDVKASVSDIVDRCGTYSREATKASLRIAFIMYIILKSMEYLK